MDAFVCKWNGETIYLAYSDGVPDSYVMFRSVKDMENGVSFGAVHPNGKISEFGNITGTIDEI